MSMIASGLRSLGQGQGQGLESQGLGFWPQGPRPRTYITAGVQVAHFETRLLQQYHCTAAEQRNVIILANMRERI